MTPEERADEIIDALRDLDHTVSLHPYGFSPKKFIAAAIRAAQAEQRQRIIAIIKGGDRPWQELVGAILAQEDE